MHFPTLIEQSEIDDGVRGEIAELLVVKARTRELGAGPVPPGLSRWFEDALEIMPQGRVERHEIDRHALERADAFHHEWVERLAGEFPED